MTNLKLNNDEYEYKNRATGDTIIVTVCYEKNTRQRGIYACIRPWVITPDRTRECLVTGHSARVLLVATTRKNDKLMATVAERIDALVPDAAGMFEGREPDLVMEADALFAQEKRIKQHGDPKGAIELLRQAMVDDAALMARAGH